MLEEYNITQTTLKILNNYTNDYKKSLHLREISREIKTDVKATQLQLKKLERINVLSSAVKGRNKEYSLNLQNIVAKYYLGMAETFATILFLKKNFLVKKIITEIDGKIDGAIVLFGSLVKGGHTKDSDVDILVITEKKIDRAFISKTSDLVGRKINIKVTNMQQFSDALRNADPLIIEVISDHIVLKGVDILSDLLWRYYENK